MPMVHPHTLPTESACRGVWMGRFVGKVGRTLDNQASGARSGYKPVMDNGIVNYHRTVMDNRIGT